MSIPKLAGLKGGQKPLDNKKELNQVGDKPAGLKSFGTKELPKFKSKLIADAKAENEEKEQATEKVEEKPGSKINKLKKEVKQIQEESKKQSEKEANEEVQTNEELEAIEATVETVKEQEEVKEEVKASKAEEVVEEKKGKRTRKSKTEQPAVTAAKENQDVEKVTDFNTAAQVIFSSFADPEWDTHEEEISSKLNEIVISSDMNSATLKLAISDVDHLRSEIWLEHNQYKNMYIDLSCEKPDGLIERVKKLNMQGDNESARKCNAIYACENYMKNGSKINLFELLETARRRYFFLKSVMDSLDFKSNSLITMSETLKNESRTLNV